VAKATSTGYYPAVLLRRFAKFIEMRCAWAAFGVLGKEGAGKARVRVESAESAVMD
jgi:hypothetical protein